MPVGLSLLHFYTALPLTLKTNKKQATIYLFPDFVSFQNPTLNFPVMFFNWLSIWNANEGDSTAEKTLPGCDMNFNP